MLQMKMDPTVAHDTFVGEISPAQAKTGRWEGRRVICTTIDESSVKVSGAEIASDNHEVDPDSGFGSMKAVAPKDARLIVRSLEHTYRELVAYPAQLKYLLAVRQAIECQIARGLDHLAIAEAASKVLAWCEVVEVPPIPAHLLSKLKQSQRLRLHSDKLTRQVDLKRTASNLKKAIRKNEQLTYFNQHQLKPVQLDYDRVLHALIDQQPAMFELTRRLQSLRKLLPDDMDMHVPMDTTIRTWAYNILLERAKTAAGVP